MSPAWFAWMTQVPAPVNLTVVPLSEQAPDVELVAIESLGDREARGLGIDELAAALAEGRPHRASGELALHVLATAEAIVRAAERCETVRL